MFKSTKQTDRAKARVSHLNLLKRRSDSKFDSYEGKDVLSYVRAHSLSISAAFLLSSDGGLPGDPVERLRGG